MRKRIVISFLVLVLPLFLFSQDIQMLKKDPRILNGKMANGLSYYIVKNDVKKGYADFYLIQKGGDAQENDQQRGITSLINDMSMRGTRNFPQHSIIDFLNDLGIDHNKDLEISTLHDRSCYRLSNIPLGNGNAVTDSMLLVLFNWACSINFDEEDINLERVVSSNQLLLKNTIHSRYTDNVMSCLLTGNNMSPTFYNDVMRKEENFTSKELRKYYYDWFRSDLQAVVIVGDVDLASVEFQIKSLFQATPRNLNPIPLRKTFLKNENKLQVIDIEDKEADGVSISIAYKTPLLPNKYRATAIPFVADYMNDMMSFLLNDRITLASQEWNIPISDKSIKFGDFFEFDDYNSLNISFTTIPESIEELIFLTASQIGRVMKDGFTAEEFARAHNRYYSQILYKYNWRSLIPNSEYAERVFNNFFHDGSLASIELHKEYLDNADFHIKQDQLNTYAKAFFKDGRDCVISILSPEETNIDKKQIENKYLDGLKEELAQFEDVPTYTSPLISSLQMGSIVSEIKEPISQSLQWTLSNGAVIVVKQTKSEPEKFYFNAISKGGVSLYKGSIPMMSSIINDVAALQHLGENSHTSLERYKLEKGMSLDKVISMSQSQLKGKAYTKDLNSLMEIVNLHFTNASIDEKGFNKWLSNKLIIDKYSNNNVEKYFRDTIENIIYQQSNLINAPKDIDISSKEVGNFINHLFSNAANYTFIIVGDVNIDLLKEAVLKHIATIPGNPNVRENWRSLPFYLNKYDKSLSVHKEMQLKKEYCALTLSSPISYNLSDILLNTIVCKLIENRIQRVGVNIGINIAVESSYITYPEEYSTIQLTFVAKDSSINYITHINNAISDLSKNGVSEDEINVVKKRLEKQYFSDIKNENKYWSDIIINRFVHGKDFNSKRLDYILNNSDYSINNALKSFLDSSVKTEFIVDGK